LVVEDALTPDEVAACNEAIDRNQERVATRSGDHLLSGGSSALRGETGRGDLGGMLTWPQPWCQPFRNLLNHRSVMTVLLEILGDGFRLDHLYGIVMTRGAEGHVLHGGGANDEMPHFYRCQSGRIRSGLTVVSWALTDANRGDGGFACIPGSHKANFPTPREVARLERDVGVVRQVAHRAGSAVIFTETLAHGTLPWRARHERRSILYKYSPGALSYSRRYLPEGLAEHLDELTPTQRALLEPPYRPNRPRIGELLGGG
jgi:ectoine hydroxylase-related dioxygenase (phytanoyl-CoA dioxygenase family)